MLGVRVHSPAGLEGTAHGPVGELLRAQPDISATAQSSGCRPNAETLPGLGFPAGPIRDRRAAPLPSATTGRQLSGAHGSPCSLKQDTRTTRALFPPS